MNERIYQTGPDTDEQCGCWIDLGPTGRVAEKMDCDYHRSDRKCLVCGQRASHSTTMHGSLGAGLHQPVFDGDR